MRLTPYVAVDPAVLDRNIAATQAFGDARGIAIRPHAKTHKSVEVARRQLAAGAVGLTVATLGEATGALPSPAGTVWIVLAAVLLAGAGAADNVSAIFRSTMLQTAAPDSMRGRLQGVFIVVVTGGPRVGDLYAGVLAATGLLFLPPLAGGVVIIGLVALLVRRRGFLAYDARHPTP